MAIDDANANNPSAVIPLGDPLRQLALLGEDFSEAIESVMRKGRFTPDSEVALLENEFAGWLGRLECVATGSGTAALEGSLFALGVGAGDLVAVAANLDISAVSPISRLGAEPYWIDISPGETALDPSDLDSAWRDEIKAVLVVHTHGYPADLESVEAICRRRGVPVIEDITHALGASANGRKTGTVGEIAVLSCSPTKPLSGIGNAGMLCTDNLSLARRAREYISYGFDFDSLEGIRSGDPAAKYSYRVVGINGVPDEIQAAVLRLKLRRLDKWIARRRLQSEVYADALGRIGSPKLTAVRPARGTNPVPRHYFLNVSRHRDSMVDAMLSMGVATTSGYVPSLHHQDVFSSLGRRALPVTDNAERGWLGLPIAPELDDSEVVAVSDALKIAAGNLLSA